MQRMDVIEMQKYRKIRLSQNLIRFRHCPDEVHDAVCSLVYAAPYLTTDAKFGQPELMQARKMFLEKYGKHFPEDCLSTGCVNPKVISNYQSQS